ncbi:RcnB family protein [Sphingomonas sp. LR59]|uniref:RcnB family protein n=1 Tax=Sphingomonas sp. LR59 TaxID=3050232 RepID=UPI002FE15B2F
MRRLLIASAGMALASGGAADAQHRPGANYDVPGTAMQAPMQTPHRPGPIAARPPIVYTSSQPAGHRAPRWGSKIGGRWWGGANAPGGWAAYRRPHRGWAVPGYWNAPRFYVNDWSRYGLPQPPQGYNWARYYDDAVLIDPRGSVYDTVSDTDWDRYDSGGYTAVAPRDYAQNDSVYAGPADRGYAAPYDDRAPRRNTGLGGAAIGAVAGGVAGNVIAGRGNRLGGTLIGAGVGAAAGYAIDKGEDRGRRAPPPRSDYGAGYAPPATYAPVYAPPSPMALAMHNRVATPRRPVEAGFRPTA